MSSKKKIIIVREISSRN